MAIPVNHVILRPGVDSRVLYFESSLRRGIALAEDRTNVEYYSRASSRTSRPHALTILRYARSLHLTQKEHAINRKNRPYALRHPRITPLQAAWSYALRRPRTTPPQAASCWVVMNPRNVVEQSVCVVQVGTKICWCTRDTSSVHARYGVESYDIIDLLSWYYDCYISSDITCCEDHVRTWKVSTSRLRRRTKDYFVLLQMNMTPGGTF